MANGVPNSWKSMLAKGQSAGLTDVFKIILMQPGFVFDKDTHHAYADVSGSEVANGNGYTTGGATLSGVSIITNNIDNRAEHKWNNVTWTAAGGSITASGAIIYNSSTLVASGDDYTNAIVSYKDAGGNVTAVDGTPVVISSIMETIEDKVTV